MLLQWFFFVAINIFSCSDSAAFTFFGLLIACLMWDVLEMSSGGVRKFSQGTKPNVSLYSGSFNTLYNVYKFIFEKQQKSFAKHIYLYIFINLYIKCS